MSSDSRQQQQRVGPRAQLVSPAAVTDNYLASVPQLHRPDQTQKRVHAEFYTAINAVAAADRPTRGQSQQAHPDLHLGLAQVPAEPAVRELLGDQGHAARIVAVREPPGRIVAPNVVAGPHHLRAQLSDASRVNPCAEAGAAIGPTQAAIFCRAVAEAAARQGHGYSKRQVS